MREQPRGVARAPADPAALRALIERRLQERDWSARRASMRAGLGPSTLQSFLSGRRGLGPEAARRLARLFGDPEDEYLRLAGYAPPPTEPLDERLACVLAGIERLPLREGIREAVVRLLRAEIAEAPATSGG